MNASDLPRPGVRASIILPVSGDAERTLRCLAALAELPDEPAHEVVIVDDASVGLEGLLARLDGDVEIVRSPRRVGLAGALRLGADAAQGDVVVLLTGPLAVGAGFLDALLGALDDERVAAATATDAVPAAAPALGLPRGRPAPGRRDPGRTRPPCTRGAGDEPRAPGRRRARTGRAGRRRHAPGRMPTRTGRAHRALDRDPHARRRQRPSPRLRRRHPALHRRRARDRRPRQRRAAAGLHCPCQRGPARCARGVHGRRQRRRRGPSRLVAAAARGSRRRRGGRLPTYGRRRHAHRFRRLVLRAVTGDPRGVRDGAGRVPGSTARRLVPGHRPARAPARGRAATAARRRVTRVPRALAVGGIGRSRAEGLDPAPDPRRPGRLRGAPRRGRRRRGALRPGTLDAVSSSPAAGRSTRPHRG